MNTKLSSILIFSSAMFNTPLHDDLLFGLLFSPEDGSYMFLRTVVGISPDYTALYPRR
jgi:hypothetical protein